MIKYCTEIKQGRQIKITANQVQMDPKLKWKEEWKREREREIVLIFSK
jgi:hypothetical protein